MKYGVIDIGSNSVRLMMSDGVKTLYKKVITTKLGEGVSLFPVLKETAIERTVDGVRTLYGDALADGADKVYAFATAAVRSAENGNVFIDRVKQVVGLNVEVVSGEVEAFLGLSGALNGKDGGIIDIGGASTEITLSKDGQTVYSHSLNLGVVRLVDLCGQDEVLIRNTCKEKIKEYGLVPKTNFYAIGGTATSLAGIDLELEVYDPKKVHGYRLTVEDVSRLAKKLISLSVEERKKLKGLQPARAEVIAGGAILLEEIMKMLGVNYITVSESDNLEGYLTYKLNLGENL